MTPSTTASTTVRGLAGALDALRWEISPFGASVFGVPGFEDRVPDVTRAAEAGYRARATQALAAAGSLDAAARACLTAPDAVTLAAVEHTARSLVAEVDAGLAAFTVSPQGEGLGSLLLVAATTTPADADAAQAHLRRVRAMGGYVDGCAERLREGAAQGRTPVAALVERTLGQLDGYLAADVAADPLVAVPAPPGLPEGDVERWRAELADAVREHVRPAVERYRALVRSLAPDARGDDRPGLVHLPGGDGVYERLVLVHTSLPLTPREVHDRGLAAVAELRGAIERVGERLGLHGFEEARAAAAASSAGVDPQRALAAAREAVARAEGAVRGWFAPPLPPPCLVEPMSSHLGAVGMPPHDTPPTTDGRRAGTYWFNVDQLGAGAGWDLEAVAYHEAVPGHHLQLERMITREDLPALQRLGVVTVHAEGWGLYAELLAEEMGLYSGEEQLLGALVTRIFRAARLVVDTGLHALGWSRSEAVAYMKENVPVAPAFIASEVDRYIAWPGQALAYFTGFEEILRLRAGARERLGDRFDIAGFHAAVLDSGGIPLPALRTAVAAWVGGRAG